MRPAVAPGLALAALLAASVPAAADHLPSPPSPQPLMEPVRESGDLAADLAQVLVDSAGRTAVAVGNLFQGQFDGLRAATDILVGSADEDVHACPAGQPFPGIRVPRSAGEFSAPDPAALSGAAEAWSRDPQGLAGAEEACRAAQLEASLGLRLPRLPGLPSP